MIAHRLIATVRSIERSYLGVVSRIAGIEGPSRHPPTKLICTPIYIGGRGVWATAAPPGKSFRFVRACERAGARAARDQQLRLPRAFCGGNVFFFVFFFSPGRASSILRPKKRYNQYKTNCFSTVWPIFFAKTTAFFTFLHFLHFRTRMFTKHATCWSKNNDFAMF